tara:strand:- start:297 stop:2429 length:2133 start_codon:yes stop_codon:yes gene_type:complete
MGVKFTNNAATTLAAGINNSVTSITVASSSTFPSISGSNYFYATFDDLTNNEVVKVTAVSGTTWTVVRAQDDTSARAFSSGDTVELRLNVALLEDALGDAATFARDAFTGDGSDTTFTLSQTAVSENNLIVFIEGIFQTQSTYSLSGTTLTFSTAPANSREIIVYSTQALSAGTVATASIIDANITTAKLADDAVTVAKMAVNSIDSDQYVDGSIDTAHIAADAVTAAKLADNAVVTANIAAANVTTAKIADDQITLAKMAGLARGKIIYGDSSGNPAALALGSNGQVLKSDGTDIAWAADTDTALTSEEVQDIAGAMFTSNTETGIAATYQDADGTIDLVVGTLNQDTTGTAATVTGAAQTAITSLGTLTALTVDDITINGSTISDASNFTLDVEGDINFDANGSDITLLDGGTEFGRFKQVSSGMRIATTASDADMTFYGNDGGSEFTALTLDMSSAGAATFNSDLYVPSSIIHTGDTDTNIAFDANTINFTTGNVAGLQIVNGVNYMAGSPTLPSGSAERSYIYHKNVGNTSLHIGNQYGNDAAAIHFETANTVRASIMGSGGLTFNGDTAAANALDDYEEGTWTPALDNITTNSSTMYGIYTKIGRIVHIHAKIDVTVASLPGAQFQISGLPYAATNTSDTGQRAIIAVGGDSLNLGASAPNAHFQTNGSTLQGVLWNGSNNTAAHTYNGGDGNSFQLHIHGHYTT